MRRATLSNSIGKRVLWVLMSACFIAFFTTSVVFSLIAARETYNGYRQDLLSLAQVIGTNCKAALVFGLPDDAETILKGLAAKPSIVSAAILDKDCRVFTLHGKTGGREVIYKRLARRGKGCSLIDGHLFAHHPVELEGKRMGTIVLEDDLKGLRAMLKRFVLFTSLLLALLMFLFYFLSKGFQRFIIRPILDLTNAVQSVAYTHDYSVRIESDRQDELGILITSFNYMLNQVEKKESLLRASRQKFLAVFNQSFQFVAVIALDGELLDVNDTTLAFCGKTRDELLGCDLVDAPWWPDDPAMRERVSKAVSAAAEDNWTRFEAIWRDFRGERYYVDCSFKPVNDPETGELDYVIMEGRDISPIKSAQEALRLSETKFRELFNSSIDAILIIEEGLVTDSNKKGFELFGLSPMEMMGKRLSDLLEPVEDEAEEGAEERLRQALEGETVVFEAVAQCRGRPGKCYVEVRMHRVFLGEADAIQVIVRDITDKKEYEVELNRLASAVRHAAEAIVIMDRDGRVVYANPAFGRISGYEQEEVIGERPRFLADAITGETVFGSIWKMVNQGKVWTGRLVGHRADGSVVDCDATFSPIFSSSSRIAGFVAVLRDITEQLKMEEKMRQTQKLEAIGTLAGGIAHDFNNILAAIFGNAELAMEYADDAEKVRDLLERLLRSAARARDLVLQILTFSRQKEGRPRPVMIKSMVKEALKLIKSTFPSSIEIRSYISSDALVISDPVHIHQIVMNLCTNAAHAMGEKGGTLTVRLEDVGREEVGDRAGQGRYVCFTVEDTGEGIPKELLDKIFDPFFTTKPEGEGTGLGLSIVHGIVKGAGGDITVESEVGKGTVFKVFLPVAESAKASAEDSGEEVASGGRGRILLVDDEEMILETCAELLERLGYSVDTAETGMKALELFRSDPSGYNIVITDLSMPRMNGFELARLLKADRPDLVVVLSTGYLSGKLRNSIPEDLIDAVLQKPFKSSEIASVLNRLPS